MQNVNLHVVAQMTAIAHRFQVFAPATFRRVAQVGRGQRNDPACPFRRMAVQFYATSRPSRRSMQPTFAHALALRNTVRILGAFPNLATDFLPTLRIKFAVSAHCPSVVPRASFAHPGP